MSRKKITREQYSAVRELLGKKHPWMVKTVAKKLGISVGTVYALNRCESWEDYISKRKPAVENIQLDLDSVVENMINEKSLEERNIQALERIASVLESIERHTAQELALKRDIQAKREAYFAKKSNYNRGFFREY